MALTLTVTNAGRVALVNAANTGTAPVTIAQIGLSGTAVVPSAAATALPGEFKRLATLSGDVVADDTIHLIVRDESADVFTVRSLAMYLADGTLFGIYGQAAVLVEKSAQALMLIAVDVKFEDIAASAITFGDANFLNPPATTEMQGVVELATSPETLAGADTQRAVTPKGFGDALGQTLNFRFGINNANIWHPGNDGSGSGLDADLLDGQDGSYYSNITARLGYTPLNKAGDTATGRITFNGNITGNNGIATATTNLGEYEVRSNGTGAAMVTFHRPGSHAVYFGVDTDNNLKVGGWSLGAVAYKMWHAGNDGAGSGLDADLLDGQDSSYFTNIPGRLGYTPANKAGDTFTGSINRDSGFYLNLVGSNPLINFDPNDYIAYDRAADVMTLYIGGAARMIWRASGNLDMGASGGNLVFNGNLVWHAGNDGAGSGLDADMLDGQDSSYYTNIPGRLGYTPISKGGDFVTSTISMVTSENAGIAARPNTSTALEVRGNGTGAAVLTFHRPNSHATFFGLDTDSRLKIGGWSMGAVAYEIWHAGNDGSGSGCDADLLDGQHGSYYSNITARLGYTPLNKAGDLMTGDLAIDKAGNTSVVLNSTGVCIARLAAQADGNCVFYRNGGGGDAFVWGVASQTGPFAVGMPITRQGNTVWDAGNDGSGSGLDADTLDGFHASDLLRIISESKAQSGYMRLSNGLLLQWGRWTSSASPGAALTVTFPVAFSAEPYTLVTMPVVTTSSGATTWSSDGISGSSFPARCSIASIGCRYFAIGPV